MNITAITYPPSLPISDRKDEIAAAIRDHQVVIVAGETGSGKTTQLPKICLELGRGASGLIGHTQPRRLAARTVAERIASELETPLGGIVGYQVRFTDQVSSDTRIKLMTDGILLAELGRDRRLSKYDTLIIDEAHERSLNIDFILGYFKRLLPRRPDLKVIITSATIDQQRFAEHFETNAASAPIVAVSGRTYPVEVRYRPLADPEQPELERDQTQAICDAVDELSSEIPGDILVFLSGEREIRDTAEALARQNRPKTEVILLYSRLSVAEQHRVFAPHRGRRIVLATNVAETSLTVPGIRYVIDPGTARISRYSYRLKVQRLPIEAISQASANQRAGRCGRLADGICIRLYSADDFARRPAFTEPEILRTSLASVILQMMSLGLGEVDAFGFIDPPDRRRIADGAALLTELGAVTPDSVGQPRKLTKLGRRLARLPLDPRLGRMLLEADRNGCVDEVMVITAALSIQDPRERPAEQRFAADEKHRRFLKSAPDDETPPSDFLSYLHLWRYLQDQQRELSSSQFRKMCKADFLHYLRVREWQDVYGQLRHAMKSLGATVRSSSLAPAAQIHQSLLAGLLSHIGRRDSEKKEYLGARGARFAVFPGSALFKKPPQWTMAAELVETSRLWGRVVAGVEPQWIEPLAAHLVKRNYSEPHWEKKQGAVMAYEKVTLYGVPIVTRRRVNYGSIDPALARELFIRSALVEGDWETRHTFFHHNRALLAEAHALEDRARRRDIVIDDEALFAFYDQRISAEIISARHFDSWWKKASTHERDQLNFTLSELIDDESAAIREEDYPDSWRAGGTEVQLSYQFEPGTETDGVTVHIPLTTLNQVNHDDLSWQVPGLRTELVTALIKSLPKPLRRNFVPVPDVVTAVLQRANPGERGILETLERELHHLTGVRVARADWQLERVPAHLRITYRVTDKEDRTVATGKDLAELKGRLAEKTQVVVARAVGKEWEKADLTSWGFGELPRVVEETHDGQMVRGYPALVDCSASVAIRVLASEPEQRRAMWRGLRRLLQLTMSSPVKPIVSRLSTASKLTLSNAPHERVALLLDDAVTCALDVLMLEGGAPVWGPDAFEKLRNDVRSQLFDTALAALGTTELIVSTAGEVSEGLRALAKQPALAPACSDIATQLAGLVYPGFLTSIGWRRLPDVLRYLRGAQRRIERIPNNVERDHRLMLDVEAVHQAYQELLAKTPASAEPSEELREIRWMIEELRVSYFAQALGTKYSISDKRIYQAIAELE